jgi:hypothetical protein
LHFGSNSPEAIAVRRRTITCEIEAQFVKEDLESRGIQEGEALSKMIERLVEAVYGIESIADLEEIHADPQIAALLQYANSLRRSVR